MIAKIQESERLFGIYLTAETLEEAATLTRFGTNRTSKLHAAGTTVLRDGTFETCVYIGKKVESTDYIQR